MPALGDPEDEADDQHEGGDLLVALHLAEGLTLGVDDFGGDGDVVLRGVEDAHADVGENEQGETPGPGDAQPGEEIEAFLIALGQQADHGEAHGRTGQEEGTVGAEAHPHGGEQTGGGLAVGLIAHGLAVSLGEGRRDGDLGRGAGDEGVDDVARDDEAEGLALEGGLELAEDEEDYALEQSGLAKSRADGEHRDDYPDDAAGEGGEHGAERSGLGGYHERHHPEGGDVVGEDGAHPPEYCQQEEAEHLHALGGEALKRGHHKEDDGRRDAKEEEYKLFGVEKRKYSLVFHWEPHSFKVLGSLFDAEAASDDAHLGLGGAAHEAHDAGVAELPGDGHLVQMP